MKLQKQQLRNCDKPHNKARRDALEAELSSIPTLDPALRKLTSASGFADYFLQMQNLYPSQLEAYERLEDFHIVVTGRRRYAEFNSFRKVLERQIKVRGSY